MDQCCDPSTWAAECAEAAVNLCSACLGGNSCCMVSSEPGCNDPDIVACVCASDPYCCQTEWDMFCTQGGIENACDFECPIPGDTCCATSPDPGCSNAAIEGCVCETDGFCCESAWDDMCVEEAIACGGCVG
jgi:hypothetical protein